MTICERIFETATEKKLKMSDLAKKLDIKQSVITNWEKRKTDPPVKYTIHICEFLGITIEYYLTGKENKELKPKERLLLEAYRRADEKSKKAILSNAEILAPEQKEKSLDSKTG